MTTNSTDIIRLDLPATFRYLNVAGAAIQSILERVEGVAEPEATIYNIQLAVHEVCTNIVEHAYANNADARFTITFTLTDDPRRLIVELHDTGHPFDPADVPSPDLDEVQVRGYGLFLIYSLMDDIAYETKPAGNFWRLVKRL